MSEEVLEEQPVEETLEASDEQASSEVESSEEVAEYTPNYSYKVKDEEFEFDEFLQGSVTSTEQEEALRELYTKSRGLEGYKDKLTSRDQEYNELMKEAGTYVDGFKTLKQHVDHANKTGDFREVGKALGLSEDKLLEYAYSLAKESELPEDQKELLNQNRDLQDKLSSVESRMSDYEGHKLHNERVEEAKYIKTTIQNSANGPDVWNAMLDNGRDMMKEFYWLGGDMMDAGLNPQVEQVVGKLINNNMGLVELKALKQQQPSVQADIGQKPTLPTVKGNNTAAVEKEISSLDELRKMASMISVGN